METVRMTVVEPPDDDFSPERLEAEVLSLEDARVAEIWRSEVAKALADVRTALGAASTSEREPLFIDISDLLDRDFPATVFQVGGLVTRGGCAMIAGEPKAATKTWIATEIAVAVATGTRACGEFFTQPGRVAYFYAEDEARQVRNRVRALTFGRRLVPTAIHGRLFVRPRGKFLDITRDEDLAWIVASVRRIGPVEMLVLDPLRDISSAAEDKSDEMAPVMRRLRLLGELLGCTVVVTHHVAKVTESTAKRRPGQRMRGSSAIHGSTDSGIYVSDAEKEGDGMTLFRNTVDAEIKGAKSAGRFEVELAIEDDAGGEAIRATWTVSRPVAKVSRKAAREDGDDKVAIEFVRKLAMRGEHLSRRALRDHDERPIPEVRLRDALDRAIEAGKLELVGKEVRFPTPVSTPAEARS